MTVYEILVEVDDELSFEEQNKLLENMLTTGEAEKHVMTYDCCGDEACKIKQQLKAELVVQPDPREKLMLIEGDE